MKAADHDSDMDEQDRYNAEMDLLKKHAEQRIAVMQGEKIKIDDEMEEVKTGVQVHGLEFCWWLSN